VIQTSLFDARRARDAGIAKTASKNSEWMECALVMLVGMKGEHHQATGEGMRIWLTANGLEAPSDPHAWGALTRIAMKHGLIRDTGRIAQMFTAQSHARRTPVWEFA